MPTLNDIIAPIETAAPLAWQESWDNAGWQICPADPATAECTGALLTLDVTEAAVAEAAREGFNLVVSHHPLLFKGLKHITGATSRERIAAAAIRHGIAIYSAHTNMDSAPGGVNFRLAGMLGLENIRVLVPRRNDLLKLVFYTPAAQADDVRQAVLAAGAGHIGGYDSCSYNSEGVGTFRAVSDACRPFVGTAGELHREPETRTETVVPRHLLAGVIRALVQAHPYEEPAYDIIPLEVPYRGAGLGCAGDLPEAVPTAEFLRHIVRTLNLASLRHSEIATETVRRIALCGGSGAEFIPAAVAAGAQLFLTADLKYHDFQRGEGRITLADGGHFETEQQVLDVFYELISKKIPNFAVRRAVMPSNPVGYLSGLR